MTVKIYEDSKCKTLDKAATKKALADYDEEEVEKAQKCKKVATGRSMKVTCDANFMRFLSYTTEDCKGDSTTAVKLEFGECEEAGDNYVIIKNGDGKKDNAKSLFAAAATLALAVSAM